MEHLEPVGIYIHIPFCAAICNYCNFNRGLHDESVRQRYVDALIEDIRSFADPSVEADTIFFGGGTPSLLEPAELGRIIRVCRDSFSLSRDAEITMEANPESSSTAKLQAFRAAGANRLSFGVQSFRDEELSRLGRLHSSATAREAVSAARAAGFENLSLDLMMWLPGQSIDQWLSSVDALIGLDPDHASLYLLEIYPNAPLRDEMARGGWSLAPDADSAAMYLEGLARLDDAGYEQYEISNVARTPHDATRPPPHDAQSAPRGPRTPPHDAQSASRGPRTPPHDAQSASPGPRPASRRSRHNLKYWQQGEWLAFGCGAHASFRGERWRTLSSTTDYIDRITAGADVRLDRRAPDEAERLEETLFMGLRLTAGLDLAALNPRHGIDIWTRYGQDLTPYVTAGLLIHEPGCRLALTRDGMLLANEVMAVFIGGPVR